MGYVPFAVENKGKCVDCEKDKPLDEMLRREGRKGVYRCVDCETTEVSLGYGFNFFSELPGAAEELTKFERLLAWCFG